MGIYESFSSLDTAHFKKMIETARKTYPNFQVVATTLRNAKTATKNDWGAVCSYGDRFFSSISRMDLEIFDRVGGGDSFASGLIYAFLNGKGPQWAVDCGAAHGALAMSTPGDTSMADSCRPGFRRNHSSSCRRRPWPGGRCGFLVPGLTPGLRRAVMP